jgi:LuxR family transcriptional regulator, maltose regulon positive regulatory protein
MTERAVVLEVGHNLQASQQSTQRQRCAPPSTEDRRNVFATVYRLCLHGLVELEQHQGSHSGTSLSGGVARAERHAGPNSVAAALPASRIAQIRYDQGRLDKAEELIVDRLPIIDAAGMLECVLRVYFVLARIAVRRMNAGHAHSLLEHAEALGHSRHWGRLIAIVMAERVGLHAAADRVTAAAGRARLARLASAFPTPRRSAWSDH